MKEILQRILLFFVKKDRYFGYIFRFLANRKEQTGQFGQFSEEDLGVGGQYMGGGWRPSVASTGAKADTPTSSRFASRMATSHPEGREGRDEWTHSYQSPARLEEWTDNFSTPPSDYCSRSCPTSPTFQLRKR